MFGYYGLIIVSITILIALWYYKRVGRVSYYLRKCPNIPCTIPFMGNLSILTGGRFRSLSPDFTIALLEVTEGLTKFFEDFYVLWVGWDPMVMLYKPELVQVVLSSNKLIEKSINYDILHPWLGRGLLTSTGSDWRARRKLLTPAFHFKIIDDFIPTMNEHSFTFVNKLYKTNEEVVDVLPLTTSCTLDIICETAMGVKINAQMDTNSEYVRAVNVLGESIMRRNLDIKGWFEFIFYRTNYGKQYLKSLNILHNFTRSVIKERKQELKNKININSNNKELSDALGRKKTKAFLDLLLDHHMSAESELTEEEIREEVDTFMFEGHGTTAVAISWSLLLIGLDKKVQRKINLEIEEVFGEDRTRFITGTDLKQLKYIECCIKEALRLYPSVPIIALLANEDFLLGSQMIPKGTTLAIYPYALHRNEVAFPQPEVFRPERFISENVDSNTHINPYSYVPFSAGPRNCIGQRFALFEEKIILTNIFRNFKIKSTNNRDRIRAAIEMIIKPKDPIRIQFSVK